MAHYYDMVHFYIQIIQVLSEWFSQGLMTITDL